MGRRLETHTKKLISKNLFLYCENAIRGRTSGCMRKTDEDSVKGIKFLEVNQKHNIDENQQERVKSKDGFEFGYERCIQVHTKTFNRDF